MMLHLLIKHTDRPLTKQGHSRRDAFQKKSRCGSVERNPWMLTVKTNDRGKEVSGYGSGGDRRRHGRYYSLLGR
jgi:hypothetical protein